MNSLPNNINEWDKKTTNEVIFRILAPDDLLQAWDNGNMTQELYRKASRLISKLGDVDLFIELYKKCGTQFISESPLPSDEEIEHVTKLIEIAEKKGLSENEMIDFLLQNTLP